MYCPDYNDLLDIYDAKQQKELDKLPRCHDCGEPIQGEHCFEFNDELFCSNCVKENHRIWTEDYLRRKD